MTLDTFRAGFTGNVLVPTSDGYDNARALWNGDIKRRPAVIAQCRTTDDVVSAIGFGREEGLEVAVRGGGHNFAGHGLCEGGLMIDLSPMRDVKVDPDARRARCGGGTTWAELDAATQVHGLATPGGGHQPHRSRWPHLGWGHRVADTEGGSQLRQPGVGPGRHG